MPGRFKKSGAIDLVSRTKPPGRKAATAAHCPGLGSVFFTLLLVFWPNVLMAEAESVLPRPDTVTMIDLGAKSCVPCKMMAPILEKLETEYKGRADVVFIDIRDHPDQGRKFAVRAIPAQIFFNKSGQEAGRHEGFLSEENIKTALDKLLSE